MTDIFSNTLELGIGAKGVESATLRSSELPWLNDSDGTHSHSTRLSVERQLKTPLNSAETDAEDAIATVETFVKALREDLEKTLEISCDFRPHLVVDELEEGALEKLADRLGIDDLASFQESFSEVGTFECREFSEGMSDRGARLRDIPGDARIV